MGHLTSITPSVHTSPRSSVWIAGNLLLSVGFVLMGFAAAVLTFSYWTDWQHARNQPEGPPLEQTLQLEPSSAHGLFEAFSAASLPGAADVRGLDLVEIDSLSAWSSETRSIEPEATDPRFLETPAELRDAGSTASQSLMTPDMGPPVWMRIPRIGVNARVSQVSTANGAYEVPAWDIGHHSDSALPGQPENSVYTGHVETIDAGRVFSRLGQLSAGDRISVFTDSHRTDWEVVDKVSVPNGEFGYIYPSGDRRITLYTCTGRFDPITRDYSHRLVITGRFVEAVDRRAR